MDSPSRTALVPPRIEPLADHRHLIGQVGHLRWVEWGDADPDPSEWITVTEREAGHQELPVTLVAIAPGGGALGAVALAPTDEALDESERQGRSPWLTGLVVRPDARGHGAGRLLMTALEQLAVEHGHSRIWVATGDNAVGFYRACGWVDTGSLTLTSTGLFTVILSKEVGPGPVPGLPPRRAAALSDES